MAAAVPAFQFLDEILLELQYDKEVASVVELSATDKRILEDIKGLGIKAVASLLMGGWLGYRVGPTGLVLLRSLMRSPKEPSPAATRYFRLGTMFLTASAMANATMSIASSYYMEELLRHDGAAGIYARAKLQTLYPESEEAQRFRDRIQSDAENSDLPALANKKARDRLSARQRLAILDGTHKQPARLQPSSKKIEQVGQVGVGQAASSFSPEETVIEDDYPRQSPDERRPFKASPFSSSSSNKVSFPPSPSSAAWERSRRDSEELSDRSDDDAFRPTKVAFDDDDQADYDDSNNHQNYRQRSSPSAPRQRDPFQDREARRRQRVQAEER